MSNNALFAIFDGNQLTSIPGLSILKTDPYKFPKRKLSISVLARSSKSKTNSAFYQERIITVRVGINRASRDLLEISKDALNTVLQGLEKELWLQQSGTVRKYYCTLQDIVDRVSGGAYWEGDLLFTCSDIYGYDTGYTKITDLSGLTTLSRSDQYNFTGSAPIQAPFIAITYTAVSNPTGATVSIGNGATGQQINVNRVWAAGDYLEIDAQNEIVRVNGVEVAFTGAFPKFAPGLGSLTYSDSMASRTFNYLSYYYRRWV